MKKKAAAKKPAGKAPTKGDKSKMPMKSKGKMMMGLADMMMGKPAKKGKATKGKDILTPGDTKDAMMMGKGMGKGQQKRKKKMM